MVLRSSAVLFAWALSAASLSWFGAEVPPGPQGPQGAAASLARGAVVTFERRGPADARPEVHVQRARLLSLAVERGETPSPFLSPGWFRASYRATVTLPVRDRYRFRVEGRGSFKLTLNGEVALEGALRPGKPIESKEPSKLKKGGNELQLDFESPAMGDGQFRLLWSGPDFGFEPIAPEVLSSPAADASVLAGERLSRGQQLFAERRCARCHEPAERRIGESAFGELDMAGPDLRNAGGRLHRDWIAAWLRAPHEFRPDATMPKFAFGSDQELHDVAAYLAGLGAPQAGVEFPADAATHGAERFLQLGCVACHVPPERDRKEASVGDRIALDYVPQKWQPGALVDYLQDPRRDFPHVRMPDLRLSRDDAIQLAAYLLKTPAAALPAQAGDADRGRRIVQQQGCAVCHALEVPLDERRAPRLDNLHADHGCLAEKDKERGKAPDHSLSADDLLAVREFLPFAKDAPFRRAPIDFARRHLVAERCTACHGLDGNPSVWARLAEQASAVQPLPPNQDPRAQGVPALTWIGSKLQPSWIQRFVLGQEKSPRPWLTARMPVFHVRGEAISAGLVREHGYGPQDEPQVAADAQSAIHGERLLQIGTGFGCVQCHALGDKPATQVFEREGINLATARGRLRHEYYTRWLQDPPRIDPDSRMPKYADNKGHTAFADVLGGDAAAQFEAIWQFLGTKLPRR